MHTTPLDFNVGRGVFVLLLVACTSKGAGAQAESSKTYSDTVYGYQFTYPPKYQIQPKRMSTYLVEGDRRIELVVEDWTRYMSRGFMRWDLAEVAAERARAFCMADGPDCSSSCTVQSSEEVPNAHGLRVIGLTRALLDTCDPGPSRTLAPMYVVDISKGGSHLLLIIGGGTDDSGIPADVLRSLVATIRLTKD